MLLGVLSHRGKAENIPYEPEMYNDSAGKRYFTLLEFNYYKYAVSPNDTAFLFYIYGIRKF